MRRSVVRWATTTGASPSVSSPSPAQASSQQSGAPVPEDDLEALVRATTRVIPLEHYPGIAQAPFSSDIASVLLAPLNPKDIEIKPDGIVYLPEIKQYRRILNKSFGPGAWALVPRGESVLSGKTLVRDYALFCLGRFVAQAKGEHESFNTAVSLSVGTAEESAKSNALMRCCKDLGVASELWDPQFLLDWKEKHAIGVFAENAVTKKKTKLWRRKDRPAFGYPWTESGPGAAASKN